MIKSELKDYVAEQTKWYTRPVLDFTNEVAVDIGDAKEDVLIFGTAKLAYRDAVEAVEGWLRVIESAIILSSPRVKRLHCKLVLPNDEWLEVNTNIECNQDDDSEDDILYTPIGTMSISMYRAIMEIPNNPVQRFYMHLQDCIHTIYEKIEIAHEGSSVSILSDYEIRRSCIVDALGVYKLDSLLYGVDEFFKAKNKCLSLDD